MIRQIGISAHAIGLDNTNGIAIKASENGLLRKNTGGFSPIISRSENSQHQIHEVSFQDFGSEGSTKSAILVVSNELWAIEPKQINESIPLLKLKFEAYIEPQASLESVAPSSFLSTARPPLTVAGTGLAGIISLLVQPIPDDPGMPLPPPFRVDPTSVSESGTSLTFMPVTFPGSSSYRFAGILTEDESGAPCNLIVQPTPQPSSSGSSSPQPSSGPSSSPAMSPFSLNLCGFNLS